MFSGVKLSMGSFVLLAILNSYNLYAILLLYNLKHNFV